MLYRCLIKLFLFVVVFSQAASAFGAIETQTSHILLKKKLSVAGSRLCTEDSYVFFRSAGQCQLHNETMEPLGFEPLDCSDLKLVPMREFESIRLSREDQIQRFFSVNLNYQVSERRLSPNGVSEPSIQYLAVGSCDETEADSTPEVIVSERVALPSEKPLLRSLHDEGFVLIHSPQGKMLDLLFIDPILWDHGFISGIAELSVSSPVCDPDFKAEFLKAGGEFTGTSRSMLDLLILEELSSPIERAEFQSRDVKPILTEQKIQCRTKSEYL